MKQREQGSVYRHKSRLLIYLAVALAFAICVGIVVFFVVRFFNRRINSNNSVYALERMWNGGNAPDYEAIYETSSKILQENPFNNTALTYRGYASFFLAVSQLDTTLAQDYLDEAINNIRIALLSARSSLVPQLEYMLGKTYFYKNTITSYYYSDLVVKYLTKAQDDGYKADDIAEYLGLSYASLGMTMESIASFTEALLVRESDTLLLSIAEQYNKAGQNSAASQYLFRIINDSENDDIIVRSRILLGNIYVEEEKFDDAQKEFEAVIEKNDNSSDAHYGLGLVYEGQGDLFRARAEWRRALRIQVNHPGALQKLSS